MLYSNKIHSSPVSRPRSPVILASWVDASPSAGSSLLWALTRLFLIESPPECIVLLEEDFFDGVLWEFCDLCIHIRILHDIRPLPNVQTCERFNFQTLRLSNLPLFHPPVAQRSNVQIVHRQRFIVHGQPRRSSPYISLSPVPKFNSLNLQVVQHLPPQNAHAVQSSGRPILFATPQPICLRRSAATEAICCDPLDRFNRRAPLHNDR